MPFTLHAAWHRADEPFADGKFIFWAETLDFQPIPRSEPAYPGASSRQRQPKPPSHPGQLPIHQLRNLIAEDLAHLDVQEMQPATTTVWLPTRDSNPVARRGVVYSTESAAAPAPATAQLALGCWQLTGLTLGPLPALVFLSQLRQQTPNRSTAAPRTERLRMGNDLLYWSNAAKFALEILIGQHYVPSLRINGASTLYALWQPALLDDRLQRRFAALVATMPAVCRAYAIDKPGDAQTPLALTEHFVATVVDAAVRAWGNGSGHGNGNGAGNPSSNGSSNGYANGYANGHAGAGEVTPPAGVTPALQWVRQLRLGSRSLALPPQPAYKLAQDWQAWIEQLHVTSDANFRIAFELVEPEAAAQSAGYTGAHGDGADKTGAEDAGADEGGQWTLRFALQARDDPRLLIPAGQIWSAYNGVLRYAGRRVDRPQERLLAGLGAASRLFAPVERSLHTSRPELAVLTPAEAHHFLCEIAPLLESNGFGVILPEWWLLRQRTALGLRLRLFAEENNLWEGDDDAYADLPARRRQRGGAPVRYAWELTLGSQRISQEEFEQLAARNVPLLKLHGEWIELDPEQVLAAKRFLAERNATGEMSLLQSIRMAQAYMARNQFAEAGDARSAAVVLDVGDAPVVAAEKNGAERKQDALPLEAVDVDGWLRGVLEQLRTQKLLAELPEPPGFVGELRPYQRRGLGWLVYLRRLGLGACLADDMGLGKTVQAIAMLLHERAADQQAADQQAGAEQAGEAERRPALLVCPTSVVANWRREVERFAPGLRVLVHHGGSRYEGEAFLAALAAHDIVITSYGTARRDAEVLQTVEWSDLILDEAQNIKNPGAKQSQAVRRFKARNRVALTGTPVENHLTELWSVLEFLNPGYLGGHEQFRQQFTVPIERYNDDEQAAELRRLVQPFLLRRLKSDPTIISDLPEKNEMVVYCSLTQEQAALYEKTVQDALDMLDRADGIQRRGLVLSLLTKLKQVCNHPAHYLKQAEPLAGRSGKLQRLTEMLEEALSVGDHALIFTQFVEMGTLLQRHLRDCLNTEVLFLHGGTPAAQRDQMVQEFQSEDGPAIFVLSLRAGGSGLNLTRANHVFHFDRWWNPAVENQATDRAFRIGQRRNVQVHKFVVAGTLEERINDIIESKQALAESIVGSGENWLTELGTEELRDLLALRTETLDE